MGNLLSPILRPLGLDPSQGYDTAAAGARQAQGQSNALSDLQWQRQMQGLGQAQQYTGQLQSLYDSMYSPGGGAPAAGGMPMGPPMQGPGGAPGGDMLLPKQAPPLEHPMQQLGNWLTGTGSNGTAPAFQIEKPAAAPGKPAATAKAPPSGSLASLMGFK